uniref:NADH-ubiquinone oxidoreductase chain 2 n=1 Tax=Paraplea frontalis TaxID=575836 RepID=A0A059T971_9HEMI|nr:NADH dehydrogenase subunit 2 [Paraplea frontalis]AHL44229.1 NADH dehydrogenase subunit 2 [Paraplea frontalis]
MKNSTKYLFYIMLIMSTIIVMSSNNWMSMWMGMEMNLVTFMPIMFKTKNNLSSESMMMYFLTQAMGSMIMLMSILMMNNMFMNETIMYNMTIIMLMSIMIKMGAAPMHSWMPEVMNKMNWTSNTILMTWQKIAPMIMMSNMYINMYIISTITMIGTIIGAMGGLNQTSVRKIMAYSSISHIAWMIMCMKFNNEMWMYYLMMYSMMVVMMTITFNKKSIMYTNQMMLTNMTNMEKMNYVIMFMSMGGMPPTMGFLPKWMVIQATMNMNMMFTMTVMLTTTLMTLFYYMRMMSTNIMMNISTNKWNLKTKKSSNTQMSILIMNILLPTLMLMTTF